MGKGGACDARRADQHHFTSTGDEDMSDNTNTGTIDLGAVAESELAAATSPLGAGDPTTTDYAQQIAKHVADVNRTARAARARAQQLAQDDVSNPLGVQRLLDSLPGDLERSTEAALQQAEDMLTLVETAHLAALLNYKHTADDGFLLFELGQRVADLPPQSAMPTLVGLARQPRYAALLSGPTGAALAERFKFSAELLSQAALEGLARDGSPEQVARSQALASIEKAKRVIGLARGGRDATLAEIRKTKPLAARR
jgi:hypothetical protein